MLVRWWRGLAAAAAAALWLGAAPAQAADLIKSGTELQYSSEGVETFGLSLTISGGTVTFNGDDPLTLGTGTGCTLLAGGQDATCPTAGITQLDVDTGVSTATGTNTLSTSDAITIEIDAAGGGGDDSLDGGGGGDTLAGAGGQDTLSGDAGTDTLTGAAGDDALAGGDGADTLSDTSGLDTITYVGPAHRDHGQSPDRDQRRRGYLHRELRDPDRDQPQRLADRSDGRADDAFRRIGRGHAQRRRAGRHPDWRVRHRHAEREAMEMTF